MSKKDDPILDDEIELSDDADFRATGSSAGGVITGENGESVLVTKAGFKKLQEELDHLKNTKRKEVAGRLKEAISYGDLSENSEYEEAKNEQAFVEGRILELEGKVKNARIIKSHDTKSIQIGSEVTLRRAGSKDDETYTIVGTTEANPFENKISNDSPIGTALMDRIKREKVKVNTPSGVLRYEIVRLK